MQPVDERKLDDGLAEFLRRIVLGEEIVAGDGEDAGFGRERDCDLRSRIDANGTRRRQGESERPVSTPISR
jgi:hypothetical protein